MPTHQPPLVMSQYMGNAAQPFGLTQYCPSGREPETALPSISAQDLPAFAAVIPSTGYWSAVAVSMTAQLPDGFLTSHATAPVKTWFTVGGEKFPETETVPFEGRIPAT